ncbi:MAG: putative cytokinetic ring protein SteA [Mobiluncus sp.]|uniref:putative cytokinetic ring protein SteA n=1 Tax=Mobiluncus sp. TaxID=47293 RepID=UPI0025889E4F|nr:putative cytokinetic ring protein SteA [Mobiluncus sp.]MCI6584627.1 putative cytokinetic ring protein SteA [Mobiluncus sp.]
MSPLFSRKRQESSASTGVVRVDSRTKNLVKRLHPGEIAVISHLDLDWVAAESLVEKRPAAVLNAQKSTSGRYPNQGPKLLLDAGIPLIDDLGTDVMSLKEGQIVEIRGNQVFRGDKLVAEGVRQTQETNAANMEAAKASLGVQIEAFTANTMEYLRRERDLLLDSVGVPDLKTKLAGRQVLMVVRGYNYKEDLQTLRPYIREYRPILIGVDGGADALLENGYKPDMIVGDMDSVSDAALKSGAEIVVHAYTNGKAPGLARVQELGVDYVVFPTTGTSEDITMLLADEKGADLIVALGTHATLVEFLDKGRAGMSSTFLTRLKVGGKLVDAKGVSKLYRPRITNSQVGVMMIAGLAALVAALGATAAGQTFLGIVAANLDAWWQSLRTIVG